MRFEGSAWRWLSGRRVRPSEAAACGFCGEATAEVDRRGRPAHKGCVARVVATVVEESRPSRDSHDLASRVAAHFVVPAGVDGYRLGRRGGELAERLAVAADLGVSVRDVPAAVVAELRALAAQGSSEVTGRAR